MNNIDYNYNCVGCFRVMASNPRWRIFQYLKDFGKKTAVSKLVKLVGLKQPTVSFHLNKLFKEGFIKRQKSGREVYCQIHKKCDDCPLYR